MDIFWNYTLLKIPYVKIQIFHDGSFTWFLNYFFAKFLEILMTGSLEFGQFFQRQLVSIFSILFCVCIAFNWVLSVKKKLRMSGFFASLPFLTYLCNKRL